MHVRFDPFAEFDRLTRDVLRGVGRADVMPADAYRLEDKLFLHVDLPGVDPESIDVTIEQKALTITAERRETQIEGATWLSSERPKGTFTRRFYLGEGLDTEHIEAGYDHGVLTVMIPLAEKVKPRKITVGAGDRALTG